MSSTYIHTEKSSTLFNIFARFAALAYWACITGILVYVWAFTWDQYTSVGTFRVSREEGSGGDVGLTQLVLPGLSDSTASDSQLAIGYINSSDMLMKLEEEFGLWNHFSQPARDIVFRLEADASLEDRLEFYRKQITTHFTPETGQTILNVRTFDPKLSQNVAAKILDYSEVFVNEVNQDVADQQIGFIRKEVQRAVDHVTEVNEEILAISNKHGFIDPDQAISLAMVNINALQAKRINIESELTTLLRDSPESPKIHNLRSEIRSIQELMEIEMAKLTGPEQDKLNQILVEFRTLQQKLALATQLRTSAEVMFEKKRIEAIANSRFFSVLQNPYLPEEQSFPRRRYVTGLIIILSFLGYLILRAILRSIFIRN